MPVYLDNAATTKPCREAVEAAVLAMTENFGNPSSLHKAGLNAQLAVDSARRSIAGALGCDAGCVYFTSGATESNNIALRGTAVAYGKRKKKIIISSVEHASISATAKALESEGFTVERIRPHSDGSFDPADFIEAADENTCLVSMMLVNNETGSILPVSKVFSEIKKRSPEIITHTDCVQGFMKLPVKIRELNADLISLSGHKIHAAKGTGALYIKKGVRIVPIITGGNQEKGIRSGTESVPLIAGFGAAVDKLMPTLNERYEKVCGLKDFLINKISAIDGVAVNSPENGLPYIVNISAAGRRSEIMLHYLEQKEIYVSSGSACSKGAQSGVLAEFGVGRREADSALRISMTAETTEDELEAFVSALAEGISKIRT